MEVTIIPAKVFWNILGKKVLSETCGPVSLFVPQRSFYFGPSLLSVSRLLHTRSDLFDPFPKCCRQKPANTSA